MSWYESDARSTASCAVAERRTVKLSGNIDRTGVNGASVGDSAKDSPTGVTVGT